MFINYKVIISFFSLLFFLNACMLSSTFSDKKHSKNKFKSVSVIDQPRYKDNGGEIKTNIINKRKVIKEKNFLDNKKTYDGIMRILDEDGKKIINQPEGKTISKTEQIRKECQAKMNLLYEEFKSIDPNTKAGYKRSLELLVEINDLFTNTIQPLHMIISKNVEVKELNGDFSFKTGSAKLTDSGIEDINNMVKEISKDIETWKNYVNNNNNRIFSNDKFKLMVVIDGYADSQGSDQYNLSLSEKRAEEVRNEFIKKINILAQNYKIVFDVQYYGKGEELPPGIEDNGMQVDARRRICRIMSVVGPSKFME